MVQFNLNIFPYVEVKVDIVMPDHPENTDNNKIDECQEIVKVQILVNHFKIPIIWYVEHDLNNNVDWVQNCINQPINSDVTVQNIENQLFAVFF